MGYENLGWLKNATNIICNISMCSGSNFAHAAGGENSNFCVFVSAILRLHDKTGWTTGLTTGLDVCTHDTTCCPTGCQTGLTRDWIV